MWWKTSNTSSLVALWVMLARLIWEFIGVDAKSALNANHTASRTKLASHAQRAKDVPVNFSWKLTKDNAVRYQSLELAGWYQTVPYLRLKRQTRWHIAIESYLPTICNQSGKRKEKQWHCRMDDMSMTAIGLCLNKNARAQSHDRPPWRLTLNKQVK
jgi:hypothetical protein